MPSQLRTDSFSCRTQLKKILAICTEPRAFPETARGFCTDHRLGLSPTAIPSVLTEKLVHLQGALKSMPHHEHVN